MFSVGSRVRFVGGGRFNGDQILGTFHLRIGDAGVLHAIPGENGDFGCSFGTLRVSLNKADIQQVDAKEAAATRPARTARAFDGVPIRTASAPRRRNEAVRKGLQLPPLAPNGSGTNVVRSRSQTNLKGSSRPRQPKPLPGQSSTDRLTPRALMSSLVVAEDSGVAASTLHSARSSSELSEAERPHPPSFYCPISHQCMHDPVVLTDGHTYERRHIERWLQKNDTSPVSGAKLPQKIVFPNHALRNAIEEYFEQVLSQHRQAVFKATAGLTQQGDFSQNAALLSTIDSLMQCSILVNADLSVEVVLKRIMEEAKSLVGAEVASVFLVDRKSRELYSNVNSTGGELRIPIKSGVAGHVAYTGTPLIIQDAYADSRFNTAVDTKTGFKTRNILCVPIKASKGGIIGIAQLINKTTKGALTSPQHSLQEGPDFTDDDQQFFLVLAAQAAAAIVNSGMFDLLPQTQSGRPALVRSFQRSQSGMHAPESTEMPADAQSMPSSSSGHMVTSKQKDIDRMPSPTLVQLPSLSKTLRENDDGNKNVDAPLGPVQLATVRPLLSAAFEGWEIDTLSLAELTSNRPLSVLAAYLFERLGLLERFRIDSLKLNHFLRVIELGYPDSNQYHNRAHGASVLHFMHALLLHGGIAEATAAASAAGNEDSGARKDLITLAGLLAAVIHDYEHEGLTNDFLVNSVSPKAILYNDRSPNENHHVSAAFAKLLTAECNFLENLTTGEFREMRRLVIDMVLATDMAGNGKLVSDFKSIVGVRGEGCEQFLPKSEKDASLVLQVALKCADVGHLALGWNSHMRWVQRLEAEFFAQGDLEKAHRMDKVSFLMDRGKPGVTQTQVGFFNFVVLPLFRNFGEAFPAAAPMCAVVEENFKRWQDVEKEVETAVSS
jgi:hypothetical protein